MNRFLVVSTVSCLLLACSKRDSPEPDPGLSGPAPAPRPTYKPPEQLEAADGAVDLLTYDSEVIRLDGPVPSLLATGNLVDTYFTTAAGRVVMGGIDLKEVSNGKETVFDDDALGNVLEVAVDSSGTSWVVGTKGVGTLAEGQVDLDSTAPLSRGIHVDDQGVLWLVDPLFKRAGDTWQKGPELPLESRLLVDPGSPLCVTGPIEDSTSPLGQAHVVQCWKDGAWHQTHRALAYSDQYAISSKGMVRSARGSSIYLYDGTASKEVSLSDRGVRKVDALAVDDRGRTWVAADAGVFVILADGSVAMHWEPGGLEGVRASIDDVRVHAGGPATLPDSQVVPRGVVRGRVFEGGMPLAHGAVEICDEASASYQYSPCDGRSSQQYTTADAEGRFVFENVPALKMALSVKAKGAENFVLVAPFDCCSQVNAGEERDLGDIDFNAN